MGVRYGVANLTLAAAVAFATARLLPARWAPVDLAAAVLVVLYGVSGVALVVRSRHGRRLARVAAGVGLAVGLVLFAGLVLTAFWLHGVYAQTGKTGALLFALVALLVLPYLVIFPAVELAWTAKEPAKEP